MYTGTVPFKYMNGGWGKPGFSLFGKEFTDKQEETRMNDPCDNGF
jgi:hypothetical protein